MNLNILEDEGRFIVDPARVDTPLAIPPFLFGDVKPISLHCYRKTGRGLVAVDLADYQITLRLGPPNVRPSLGFWQLSTTEGSSPFISARANAQEVQDAMQAAFGANTVEGGQGSYVVTVGGAGIWTLPTATFHGATLSDVLVFQISSGTVTTPAQYRVELLEVAPARVIPDDWTAGNTTPSNSFTQTSGKLWHLVIDTAINNGFFTLTIDGVTTGFISCFAGAYDIEIALSEASKPANAQADGSGGFWVSFVSTVTVATIGGNLVILPFSEGVLDLSGSGLRELLDGEQFAPVKLSVVIVKDGQTVTAASADAILQMPINQPAVIEVDSPQMAGISFAIGEDGYMHVYQNGTLLADIPLNNPL